MASLANDLCHLKSLVLLGTYFGILDEVFTALCLIRNCKNLKRLTIIMCPRSNIHDIELKEIDGFSDVSFEHLGEVKLKYVSGLKCEMQLIELILAKSPVLEKFVIEPSPLLYDSEKLRFLKKVSKFRCFATS